MLILRTGRRAACSYFLLERAQRKNTGLRRNQMPTRHSDSSHHAITPGWSLALIGNASGQTLGAERDLDPRRFRLRRLSR
jgi:hypothetical protein